MTNKLTDLSYLEEMSGGSVEIIQEMLKLFVQQLPEATANLNHFYNSKDWHNLAETAHSLKSSLKIIGVDNLASSIERLEQMAKNSESVEKYSSIIEEFEIGSVAAVGELREWEKMNNVDIG